MAVIKGWIVNKLAITIQAVNRARRANFVEHNWMAEGPTAAIALDTFGASTDGLRRACGINQGGRAGWRGHSFSTLHTADEVRT
jgi:hypothetical protein